MTATARVRWRRERLEKIKAYCVAAPVDSEDEDDAEDIGVSGGGSGGRGNGHGGGGGGRAPPGDELTVRSALTEAERRASVASATGGAGGIPRWAEGLHRTRIDEEAETDEGKLDPTTPNGSYALDVFRRRLGSLCKLVTGSNM